jgi:hypothetical protein
MTAVNGTLMRQWHVNGTVIIALASVQSLLELTSLGVKVDSVSGRSIATEISIRHALPIATLLANVHLQRVLIPILAPSLVAAIFHIFRAPNMLTF